MHRRDKDSMRDIPREIRYSLEFLDNLLDQFDDPSPPSTLRTLRHVPPDVRKSLQMLDNILVEYGGEDGPKMSRSTDDLKCSADEPEDVSKSLEMLDRVLDEFQCNAEHRTFGRKTEAPSMTDPNIRLKHEDVRRSLEVLDSVLAEFDDCLESWDTIGQDSQIPDDCFGVDKLKASINGKYSVSAHSFDNHSVDGDTSHDSGLSLQEQTKVSSPPPVPKRSLTTKLSDRSSGLFNFQLEDAQSFDSIQSDSPVPDNDTSLSTNDTISILSAKDDDEVFGHSDNNAPSVPCCMKCGREICSPAMEKDVPSSPFLERRKIFEGEPSVSTLIERSFTGSSFKVRDRAKGFESEPSSPYRSLGNGESIHSTFTSKYSPKATKVTPPRVEGLLSLSTSLHHAPNCNCKERIRQLQLKFEKTRLLLKANKIKGLDSKPPSFVPPPPPPPPQSPIKNIRNEVQDSGESPPSIGLPRGTFITQSKNWPADDGVSAHTNSISSEENSANSLSTSFSDCEKKIRDDDDPVEGKFCKKCSKSSEHLPLSETIEDLPKLLPTDALKRPHLGLSYSMEDDLCPGVKDILQSSTLKSGLPLSKNNKTNLSTFSLSDSSLGYVSSQSDFELNNSPMKTDKVPVSTVKFKTLPEGMDLHSLPSYYGQDEIPQNDLKPGQPMYRDRNFNHTIEPQLRSSSAPPQPSEEAEKPKKKHFRAFSRKEKKKNEDNISLKSHLSLDERIILKSLDGDTNKVGGVDGSQETGVERKRWSALRSILRKNKNI